MGRIWRVSGPVVIAEDMRGSQVYEVVDVGDERLTGEIIGLEQDKAVIQVYEDTVGLRVGEPVVGTGEILMCELGPGMVGNIYDGVQRSLVTMIEDIGDFLHRGVRTDALDRNRKWEFVPTVKAGDTVQEGDVIGTVQETGLIEHRIMVPIGLGGKILEISEGKFTILDTVAVLEENGTKTPSPLCSAGPFGNPGCTSAASTRSTSSSRGRGSSTISFHWPWAARRPSPADSVPAKR